METSFYAVRTDTKEILEHLDELALVLPRERKERIKNLKNKNAISQAVCAYALLFYGLNNNLGFTVIPPLDYGPYGKPQISGQSDLHFNISHTEGMALCAIGPYPVGCDVQIIRDVKIPVAKKVLSEREYEAFIKSDSPEEMFCTLWTLKESFLKYDGRGLHAAPSDVCFFLHHDRIESNRPGLRFNAYSLHPHWMCAICLGEEGTLPKPAVMVTAGQLIDAVSRLK